jgi:hypothetical protein
MVNSQSGTGCETVGAQDRVQLLCHA